MQDMVKFVFPLNKAVSLELPDAPIPVSYFGSDLHPNAETLDPTAREWKSWRRSICELPGCESLHWGECETDRASIIAILSE